MSGVCGGSGRVSGFLLMCSCLQQHLGTGLTCTTLCMYLYLGLYLSSLQLLKDSSLETWNSLVLERGFLQFSWRNLVEVGLGFIMLLFLSSLCNQPPRLLTHMQ